MDYKFTYIVLSKCLNISYVKLYTFTINLVWQITSISSLLSIPMCWFQWFAWSMIHVVSSSYVGMLSQFIVRQTKTYKSSLVTACDNNAHKLKLAAIISVNLAVHHKYDTIPGARQERVWRHQSLSTNTNEMTCLEYSWGQCLSIVINYRNIVIYQEDQFVSECMRCKQSCYITQWPRWMYTGHLHETEYWKTNRVDDLEYTTLICLFNERHCVHCFNHPYVSNVFFLQ